MENITKSNELDYMPFQIPGATSEKLFVKLLNLDTQYGPVFAELKMEAGAYIPAHIHHKTEEQHYVLEGDFINDGITYEAGAFFSHDIGQVHGPHSTKNGCRILFIQPNQVDPTDFEIAD
ncbi:cupin domain-containing protein [Flavobacterium sp.]|uniref:cupin domain-containing protein n=1 Tax=Flavobacterium sp. TaxID=239 RepID=UPI00286BE6C0|nr:cupin domain-containing protein [Flavobacterium sp.]